MPLGMWTVLTAMSSSDEGALTVRSGEDDVIRLISNPQGAHDSEGRAADIDDADAIRHVIHHPDLAGVGGGHGDRLHAYWYGAVVGQPVWANRKYLKTVVGGVDGVQPRAVGRQGQWPHVAGFKGVKRRLGLGALPTAEDQGEHYGVE